MEEGLQHLNSLARREAEAELLKCCGSARWARAVADARPFESVHELLTKADSVWWSLDAADWLESFSHHPKIGERAAKQTVAAEAQRWSEDEQSGARDAAAETLAELVQANHDYERRFGYIFIVCATGKTSAEMLALLRERIHNEPETELRIAAEEQRKITDLRLRKLLES
ncbi:MAG: 2-oxo-4-hydroxy-4-carboxy-5-ureidoimidazoline decarboxylase [Pyrinomonadaceae bacterium]